MHKNKLSMKYDVILLFCVVSVRLNGRICPILVTVIPERFVLQGLQ